METLIITDKNSKRFSRIIINIEIECLGFLSHKIKTAINFYLWVMFSPPKFSSQLASSPALAIRDQGATVEPKILECANISSESWKVTTLDLRGIPQNQIRGKSKKREKKKLRTQNPFSTQVVDFFLFSSFNKSRNVCPISWHSFTKSAFWLHLPYCERDPSFYLNRGRLRPESKISASLNRILDEFD